jgi:hypothetical protein
MNQVTIRKGHESFDAINEDYLKLISLWVVKIVELNGGGLGRQD